MIGVVLAVLVCALWLAVIAGHCGRIAAALERLAERGE